MSVQWTPVAVGVPHARAVLIQERLEGAGIAVLTAETTSWIGKLRAFIEGAPDLSIFVDKAEVEKATVLVQGIIRPADQPPSVESYVRTLDNDQLKRLIAASGWPDLVLDPARQVLHERTAPPAPTPQSSPGLPVLVAVLCVALGPLGSWISRQIIPRAQPWEDRMIPLYDEPTRHRCAQAMKWGVMGFVGWIVLFMVVKCFR